MCRRNIKRRNTVICLNELPSTGELKRTLLPRGHLKGRKTLAKRVLPLNNRDC
jgi:hypothetical protein